MSSASLFEQLTSSVSLSMMTIVSVGTLALILLATVACRVFFSSSTKSKSKQLSNKDKKTKEANTKKQQTDTTSSNKKKTNSKTKKNGTATPSPPPAKPAVSTTSQSEESDDEQVDPVAPTKKSVTSNKASTGKKLTATDANNKHVIAANEIKTSSTKQQQQVSARNENVVGTQSGDAKKKQSKPVETPVPSNKQQTTGKTNATNKVNTTATNKKQPVVANSEVKQTLPEDETSIQEDEGQWVTQGSKQVNNRNRNKGKNETSNTNNQESSPTSSSKRKTASEKQTAPTPTASSSTNKNEFDVETTGTSNVFVPPPPKIQEPIEICQLLPTSENRYTANDNWWKQTLNKQPTFSIDDIGEWPEREQDEQYIVNVKRIIPIKNTNTNNKTALTEKDINVDDNDQINNYKNAQEDEKLNFDEQTNSSSVVPGETTTTTSQSKKKSTNVRRLS